MFLYGGVTFWCVGRITWLLIIEGTHLFKSKVFSFDSGACDYFKNLLEPLTSFNAFCLCIRFKPITVRFNLTFETLWVLGFPNLLPNLRDLSLVY